MSKLLYGLALGFLVLGIVDASRAAAGAQLAIELGMWFVLAPVLAVAGFAVSRAPTRKCAPCSARNKKGVAICQHCGRSTRDYRRFYPSN